MTTKIKWSIEQAPSEIAFKAGQKDLIMELKPTTAKKSILQSILLPFLKNIEWKSNKKWSCS